MAALTIATIDVRVSASGSTTTQAESFRVGSATRAYDGTLRSTVRAEKRVWKFQTALLQASEIAALRAAVALGAIVSATGDLLYGETVSVVVTITDGPLTFVHGGFRQHLMLSLEEV